MVGMDGNNIPYFIRQSEKFIPTSIGFPSEWRLGFDFGNDLSIFVHVYIAERVGFEPTRPFQA